MTCLSHEIAVAYSTKYISLPNTGDHVEHLNDLDDALHGNSFGSVIK